MKSLALIGLWIGLATCLLAQDKVVVKEMKATEKTVSVDVSKDSDGMRTVKVITEVDGEKDVLEWTDNGTIPADIQKQLDEQDINLNIDADGAGNGKTMTIEVDNDGGGLKKVRKEVIMIKKGDDDGIMELEWDGTGEMPAEMRELLDEHDIDIESLHEGHDGDGEKKKVRIRKMKEKHAKMHNKAKKRGRAYNEFQKENYKIITKDGEGNEKVFEWEGDGEMPEGMEEMLDGENINIFRFDDGQNRRLRAPRRMMFIADEEDKQLSNAYMGAQIESQEDGGTTILDVMKDSPADKAGLQSGDVVHKINGARSKTMDDLLTILSFYEPNDQIELMITRDGQEKKLKLTLGERPEHYR